MREKITRELERLQRLMQINSSTNVINTKYVRSSHQIYALTNNYSADKINVSKCGLKSSAN